MDIYKYVNRTSSELTVSGITIPAYGMHISTTGPVPELERLDGVLVDKYLNQLARQDPDEFNYYRPVVSPSKGDGMQLNSSNPSFGWHDLLSPIIIDLDNASSKPTFAILTGTLKKYQFKVGDESYHQFHLPHDYLPGSDLFIHVHWTTNIAPTLNGTTTWNFEATYAKGYAQQAFVTPVNVQVVGAATSTTPLIHYISEIQLTGAGKLDASTIETDGLILVRTSLLNHTLGVDPFMMFCDVHYQSTNMPTLNRNYNFWQ